MSLYSDFFPSAAASGGAGITIGGVTYYGATTPFGMPRATYAKDNYTANGDYMIAATRNRGAFPEWNQTNLTTNATSTVYNQTTAGNGAGLTFFLVQSSDDDPRTMFVDVDMIVDGTTYSLTNQPIKIDNAARGGCFVMGRHTLLHQIPETIIEPGGTVGVYNDLDGNGTSFYGTPTTYAARNDNAGVKTLIGTPNSNSVISQGGPFVYWQTSLVIQVTVTNGTDGVSCFTGCQFF